MNGETEKDPTPKVEGDTEKDQRTRIEKYAQGHLDRVHTVSSGATKAALTWIAALLIIWYQLLEPKLAQVQAAQASRRALRNASALGPQRIGISNTFNRDEELAGQQQIELPFSIKLTLAPYWVPTFWLGLAFGLSWYLLDARRKILRLAARGIRLLQGELKTEPPYSRSVTGEAIWWLAPLPSKSGKVVNSEQFSRGLGWTNRGRTEGTILAAGAILLLLAETRIVYIGFCIASYLTGKNRQTSTTPDPTWWIIISCGNIMLFVATIFCVWRWFEPAAVPDAIPHALPPLDPAAGEQARIGIRRRDIIRAGVKGAAVGGLAILWIVSSISAFAAITHRHRSKFGKQPRRKHIKRRGRTPASTPVPQGIYVNQRTGTVHTVTPQCKTCLTRDF